MQLQQQYAMLLSDKGGIQMCWKYKKDGEAIVLSFF